MKKKKFYRLSLKDHKKIGVLYAPKGTDTHFGIEILPVENYEHMVFTLKGGAYAPYLNANVFAYFMDTDLKELIEEVVPKDYPLEFLPVRVTSEEFGDRIYYIVHFTKIFDVIDDKNSIRIPNVGTMVKPYLDYEKVKDLDFFNSTAFVNEFFVSDTLRKLIKKHQLDLGINFVEIPYVTP